MRGKIKNIQALRAIAVLLVLLYHSMLMEAKYGGGERMLPDLFAFGTAGVDLFFAISGFVMVTVSRDHFGSPKAVAGFLYDRVTRIYPVYWVYSLVLAAVWLVRPELVNPSQGNQVDFLRSFLLLPGDILPLLMVGWTLIHEVYFYLVFTVILLAGKRALTGSLLLFLFFVVSGNIVLAYWYPAGKSAALSLVTHPLTVEFIAGCFIAKLAHRGAASNGFFAVILGAVLFISGCGAYYSVLPGSVPEGWLRLAIYGVPAALVLYGAVALEFKDGVLFPKYLNIVGDASYSIYLSHTLVISVIGLGWTLFPSTGYADNAVVLLLMAAASVIFGILSFVFMEKPMLTACKEAKKRLGIGVAAEKA